MQTQATTMNLRSAPFFRTTKGALLSSTESSWHGLQDYAAGLQIQEQARREVVQGNKGILLGMEHPEVLTLGVRSQSYSGVEFTNTVRTQRGGEATIHNPGQLVIYPILNLRELQWGARKYVELLLATTEDFFAQLSIPVFRQKEPGLYTQQGKIALFGVQIRGGITGHGLSINVSNDLNVFSKISVCGVKGQPLDRVSDHYDDGDLQGLFQLWCQCFHQQSIALR